MAKSDTNTEIDPILKEATEEGFDIFCDDIAMMFDVNVSGQETSTDIGVLKDLKKKFKKLCCIWPVKSEGLLDGRYYAIVDKEGMFTLGGTFVMQPEQVILKNRKSGTTDASEDLKDAIGEVGNLLVGSFDRHFRENHPDHGHMVQDGTFMGQLSEASETFDFSDDDTLHIAHYQMEVEPFDPFNISFIYPEKLLSQEEAAEQETQDSDTAPADQNSDAETTASDDKEKTQQADDKQQTAEATQDNNTSEDTEDKSPSPQQQAEDKTETKAQPEDKTQASTSEQNSAPEPESTPKEEASSANQPEPQPEPKAKSASKPVPAQDKPASPDKSNNDSPSPVRTAIKQLIDGSLSGKILEIPVKDILQPVHWISSSSSIQDALELIQANAVDHIIVGQDNTAEGIISISDINAGMSPYLKPVFSKWKRPQDTATLNIQLKWLMSQPVYFVNDQANLRDVIRIMADNKIGFVPVKDSQGKILGAVSTHDLLLLLLSNTA